MGRRTEGPGPEGDDRAVRRAGPGDAARLARLRWEFRAAEDPPVEAREEFVGRCEPWMERRLGSADSPWRCWVVEPDDRIRGHVWVQLVPKVPNPVEEAERHAYLTNTYVEPGYRGRGLGTALVGAAVSWARGGEVDSLVLWPTEGSRSLYRRFGCSPSDGLFELELNGG